MITETFIFKCSYFISLTVHCNCVFSKKKKRMADKVLPQKVRASIY